MKLEETVRSKETAYQGRVFSVQCLKIELPDGTEASRDIVSHHGGATVVALTDKGNVLLVRQYRIAVEQTLVELPAGKLEPDEDPLLCAQRELSEETGFRAESWIKLGEMMPSPGYTSEKLHLYLAEGLRPGTQHLDPGEFLDAFEMPFSEALRQVESGELSDGKTALGILLAKRYLDQRSSK